MEISKAFINNRSEIRAGWRILLYAAMAVICGFIVFWLYSTAAGHFARGAMREKGGNDIPEYLLLSAAFLFPAFCMLRFVDRRPFSALGFPIHGRVWVEISQGLFQGFTMVSIVFLIEWGAGWMSVTQPVWSPWKLIRFSGHYIVLFTFAGTFEEIVARGYAFQALIQGTGRAGAVCLSSLLFGLGHAANPHASVLGVINTMLAGVWLSVAYLKTRSLWLPASLHMAWNLAMGFVYGFPLSGVPLPGTVLRLAEHGPIWLTGGDYGPEAGAVATPVLVWATVYLWRSKRVRPAEQAIALWHTPEAAHTGVRS
jgi:membrane protease YdiL (CAAX protease family)